MDGNLANNDKTAQFEALALPHLDAAYNLARWLTRNEQDAEDLVQTAYLRAFRFVDGFRGGDARAWLMTIVRHTYYTALRDSRSERADVCFDEDVHSDCDGHAAGSNPAHGMGDDPACILERRDSGKCVNEALASLPRAFREVLVMKEMEDLSYRQIAQIADIPIGTVMSRLARARKLLAACLQPAGE